MTDTDTTGIFRVVYVEKGATKLSWQAVKNPEQGKRLIADFIDYALVDDAWLETCEVKWVKVDE